MIGNNKTSPSSTSYLKKAAVPFERKQVDVTDHGCQWLLCLTCPLHFMPLVPGMMGSKTLIMEEEEAVLEVRGGLCNVTTRRPYGELGSVDRVDCLCCSGISSDLFRGTVLCPGSGCQYDVVSELVTDLKARMKARGDTGQIKRAEDTLAELKELREEVGELRADMKKILSTLTVVPANDIMNR